MVKTRWMTIMVQVDFISLPNLWKQLQVHNTVDSQVSIRQTDDKYEYNLKGTCGYNECRHIKIGSCV